MTKKGEKTTGPTKESKKLKLNKRTVKDLGAKDASGVKGGTVLPKTFATCAITCGDCRTLKCATKVCTYVKPC